MAEAAVESPAARFFCHKCTQEICPVLPDYICPRCQSGFIEELTQGPQEHISEESDEEVDPLAQVAELWNMLHFLRRVDPEHQNSGGTTENQQSGNEGLNSSRPGPSRRHHRFGRGASRRQGQEFDSFRQPRTEGFLQQLVASLSENTGLVANASFPVFLNLHSNPGDYAWGRGGWNAIITQLMNQLDGTGPPPLPKEKIEEIPVVNISQEQVDKILQCTVCMEDFRLGEPVKKLSCQHHFHNDCIIPWLELHGTCPICRKLLNDESSQDSPIGSTLTNTSSSSTQPGPSNTRSQNRRSSNSSTTATGTSYSPHLPSVYDFTDEFD